MISTLFDLEITNMPVKKNTSARVKKKRKDDSNERINIINLQY